MMRRDVEFTSDGVTCRAWLFLPKGEGMSVPCIVMAHGFGATRECRLEPYAIRFAEDGYAVLVFDYRHFGASDGQPRQLLSVKSQLEDWQSAIDYARTAERVDPERIALWGSSFSGGHVIAAAVRDGRVVAVSSQCPMMDGRAASLAVLRDAGLGHTLLMGLHGALDLVRSAFGASPHTIPIVGPPGSIAAMSTEDAEPGYRAMSPSTLENAVAARITLALGSYRPGTLADRLPCPVLIQICEKDSVAPTAAAEAAAKLAGSRAEVKRYPIGHFAPYVGKDFELSVADQRAFFRRHLLKATA
ncbi:MAG TPA: alpha/beta hydrolase [Polyangiaceae bacterium]